MKKNLIEDSVKGIEFNNQSKQRILEGINTKMGTVDRQRFCKIRVGIAVAAMFILIIFTNIMLKVTNKTVISVYAMSLEGDEVSTTLSLEQEITLMPLETPVGYGYIFEVDIPEGCTYENRPIGNENNIFTVYQNGERIYWIPNHSISGNIYNSENDKLLTDDFQDTTECQFEILIYNKNRKISENRIVEFKLVDNRCNVVLKK
ncbi:MAG: hypothetical protein SOW34_03175 [Oliverpabstia sp.]|nr:hypothetical protein [Eubacterium sp.]MDY2593908.1 hypothetical protein [Oliverpabstia sp.]